MNDKYELRTRDRILDIEALAGVEGDNGLFVQGIGQPARHVDVYGLYRVVRIARFVGPHAYFVAKDEIKFVVPVVVSVDVIGIKPKPETGSGIGKEIAKTDGEGTTDRLSWFEAGITRLNCCKGYLPGTKNMNLLAIDYGSRRIGGRETHGQAGSCIGFEHEWKISHRVIKDRGEAYALRHLDYGQVIGHRNSLGIKVASALGGYDFRSSGAH